MTVFAVPEEYDMTKNRISLHTQSKAREEMRDVIGCMGCGMPMERTPREASSEITEICPACADSAGQMKSYVEVFERLVTQHYMKELRMSRPEAEKAAREIGVAPSMEIGGALTAHRKVRE